MKSGKPSEKVALIAEKDEFVSDNLWIAAKYLDRSKICKCLLNDEALDEIRESKRNALVPSSNAAQRLHDSLFPQLKSRKNVQSDQQQSTKEIFDLTDKERRIMNLRAMLLLPPYCLTPWETSIAVINSIRLKVETNGSSENYFDASEFVERKTICDIKIFFSSICEGGGSVDDHRCMESQRKMVKEVCIDITTLVYKHRDISPLVCKAMFQLLTSIFQASLRMDDCAATICNISPTARLPEFILNNIINYDGCIMVKVHPPVLCSAISTASSELSGYLTTDHWRSLQQFVLKNIYTCTALTQIDGLIRLVIHGISRDYSSDNGCNKIWNGWVEIFLHAYQKVSPDQQILQRIETQMTTMLAAMRGTTMGSLAAAVVAAGQSLNLNHSDFSDNFREIQLNVLLLIFQAEESVANSSGAVTIPRSAKNNYYLHDPSRHLMNFLKKDGTINMNHDNVCKDLTICAFDAMKKVGTHFEYVCRDVSNFQGVFEICQSAVRASVFLNSDCTNVWPRWYIWRRVAHYLISDCHLNDAIQDCITFASAILVALYLELPSCREEVMHEIANILCTVRHDVNRVGCTYCWILCMLTNITCEADMLHFGDNRNPFGHFSILFEALKSSIETIPRSVCFAMFQSLACIPSCRMEILSHCKKVACYCKLSLRFVNNVDCKDSCGIEGLMFLIQKNLQTNGVLDRSALEALCYISDEIAGEEADSVRASYRMEILSKIIAACRSGYILEIAIERIVTATIVRMLPFFRSLRGHSDPCCFGFDPSLTHGSTLSQEIPSLVLLLLTSLGQMPIPLKWRDLTVMLGNSLPSTDSTFEGIPFCQDKSVLLAISFVKALIDIPHIPSSGLVEADHGLSLVDCRKQLCESESKFWKAQIISHVCPAWSSNPLVSNVDEVSQNTLADTIIGSVNDQLARSLADGLLWLWKDDPSTTCAEYKDEFAFSFLVNSVLSGTNLDTESVMQVDHRFDVSVIKTFFYRTARVFQAMMKFGKDKKMEYVDLTLSAVQKMCTSRVGALLNCGDLRSLFSSSLYRSIAEFYCVFWDREGDGSDFEMSCRAISGIVLSALGMMLQSPVTFPSISIDEMGKVLHCHCKLLQTICGDFNEFTLQNLDQIKTMEVILAEILESRQFVRFGNKAIANTCAVSIRRSLALLWNTLQIFDGTNRSVFKSLISVAIYQIPRLLRVFDRLTVDLNTSLDETPLQDTPLQFSHSVVSFEMCVEDSKIIVSHRSSIKPNLSWLSANDLRITPWSLSVCIENITSLWTETGPTNVEVSLLDRRLSCELDLKNPNTTKYAMSRVFELGNSLLLFTSLLSISPESDMNQKLHTLNLEIVSAVSRSANFITSFLKEGESTEPDIVRRSSGLHLLEAIICIFSVLKATFLSDSRSELESFVKVVKGWCKNQSERQAVKFNGLVLDLNASLMECSREMKRDKNLSVFDMFRYLAQDISVPSPSTVIDTYLESFEFDLTLKIKQRSAATQSFHRDERSKKRRHTRRKGRKQGRSRNGVVNEWLELDRDLDKESTNDGFGDLDDFLLPG